MGLCGDSDRTMEGYLRGADAAYGTVVYDPPHVGPQGRDKSTKRFDVDFAVSHHAECGADENWSLSYLYPHTPFLEQAKRVLKPNGLLVGKDHRHGELPPLQVGSL